MEILRIKQILNEKGLSITDFANASGLSYTYASEVVRNVKFPRKETLLEIANALDVDIRDLFANTKTKDSQAIFIKDESGQMVRVGEIDKSKL